MGFAGQRCFRTRGSNGSGRWSKRGDRCDISYGKNGRHKLVKDCTVPLTGRKVVNTLVTEYAVFKFKDGMMFLLEHTSDVTLEEIAAMTSAHYELAEKISIREV